MGIPDHLICLLRTLCAGQEATVRTGHGTTDWFQTGKGVCQGCILSPCLFNLYAEYIMRNAGLDEAQAGIRLLGEISWYFNSSVLSLLYSPTFTSIYDYWKNHSFDYTDLCQQNYVSAFWYTRFVIAFLPGSKCLLISWLQSPSGEILEPKKIKSVLISVVSPSIFHEVMGLDAIIFVFECWVLNQRFHSPLSSLSLDSLVPLCCHLHILGYWYFSQQSDPSLCFIQPSISHDVLCI